MSTSLCNAATLAIPGLMRGSCTCPQICLPGPILTRYMKVSEDCGGRISLADLPPAQKQVLGAHDEHRQQQRHYRAAHHRCSDALRHFGPVPPPHILGNKPARIIATVMALAARESRYVGAFRQMPEDGSNRCAHRHSHGDPSSSPTTCRSWRNSDGFHDGSSIDRPQYRSCYRHTKV